MVKRKILPFRLKIVEKFYVLYDAQIQEQYLSIAEWNENIKHFLDLTDETLWSVRGSKKTMGAVLLGAPLHGRLFVKGIHVQDLKGELK